MDAMQFSDDELNDLTNELSNQTGFQSADIARTLLQNACEYRSTELSMPLTKQECIESVKHLLTLLAKIKKMPSATYEDTWRHVEFDTPYASFMARLFPSNTTYPDVPNLEGIELAAKFYVETPWMKSRMLEWLLIDAMTYHETISFGSVIFKKVKLWSLIPLPAWASKKSTYMEGLALFVTAMVASGVDSNEGVIFWVVFFGITIIRWLRPKSYELYRTSNREAYIFREMIGIYQSKLARIDFNASLLKYLFCRLEEKGASFSPWLFYILDKRIHAVEKSKEFDSRNAH